MRRKRCRIVSEPQHLIDAVGAGGDHRQPVEAEGDAGGWRHAEGERREEILIERPIGTGRRVAPRPIGLEARALLVGIGQLDEGIGQFDAADEQLEPLGDARIGRIAARQRGLRGGPVGEEGGMRAAELRLDPLEQQAEEQVLPALVLAQARPRRGRERRGVLGRGQHIGADVARERVRDGEAFDRATDRW